MRDRAKKQHLSQLRRMRYAERRLRMAWYIRKRKARQRRRNAPHIEWRVAPSVFSIVDNAIESLGYLSSCGDLLRRGMHVGFDLKRITRLTPDMIPLLIALVCDKSYTKTGIIHGNQPQNPQAQKLFASSGFLKFVRTTRENREEIDPEHCLLTNDLISGEEAEGKASAEICQRVSKLTFGGEKIPEDLDLYPMVMEIILNTKNHASLHEPIKWWIYTHSDTATSNTSCTILDLGSGIFEGRGGEVKNFVDYFVGLFKKQPSHKDIAEAILDGTIISTKKKDQERRGKGLQQILDISKSRYIAKAVLYSNDIKIDLKDRTKEILPTSFRGTFYHFEITNHQAYV